MSDPTPGSVTLLYIQKGNERLCELKALNSDPIYLLKEKISSKYSPNIGAFLLVHRGKVLCDEITLGGYHIRSGSTIYLVETKVKPPPRPKASDLMKRMETLIRIISSGIGNHEEAQELSILADHPILRANARFDDHVAIALDEARQVLDHLRRALSEKTKRFIAHAQDIAYTQIEGSTNAYQLMNSILEEQFIEPITPIDNSCTRINYVPQISETPLPNAWVRLPGYLTANTGEFVPHVRQTASKARLFDGKWSAEEKIVVKPFEREYPVNLKEKFAPQVSELKKMGFTNDAVILEALAETDGNVQLAALLIQKRLSTEC